MCALKTPAAENTPAARPFSHVQQFPRVAIPPYTKTHLQQTSSVDFFHIEDSVGVRRDQPQPFRLLLLDLACWTQHANTQHNRNRDKGEHPPIYSRNILQYS